MVIWVLWLVGKDGVDGVDGMYWTFRSELTAYELGK